jgi:uncharacterized membrane protein YdjX (TVP38/TMEM64 family)
MEELNPKQISSISIFARFRKCKFNFKAFAVVLAIALFLYISSEFQNIFFSYVEIISNFFREHTIIGAVVFVLISGVAVILFPFSSVPLIPSAIMVWGNMLTVCMLIFGWFFGGWSAYFIGGYASKKIISRYFDAEKIEFYKNKISSRAQFWFVILFRLAIPSEITGYTLGVIRYPLGRYLIATLLTEIPFAFAAVYLGTVLIEGRFLLFALLLVFVAAMAALASYFFHRKI